MSANHSRCLYWTANGAQQKGHLNKQQIVSACHSRWLYWTAMGPSRRAIQTSNRQSLPVILAGYTGQLWGPVEEPFKQAIESVCLSFSLAILDSYGAQQKSHSNKQQIVSACHSRWLYWTAMGLSRRAIQTSNRQSLPVILAAYTGQLWDSVEEPFKQAIESVCLSFLLAILDSYGAQQKSHSNKQQIVSACHYRWLYWTAMGPSRRAIQTSNRQSLPVILAGYTGQLWDSVEEPFKQAIDSLCLSFSLAILDSYGTQQKSHSNKQQIVSACHCCWLYWTAMGLSRRAPQTSNRQSMPVILAGYTGLLWDSVEEPFKQAIDSLCLSFSLAILDSYGTQQKSHSNKQQIVSGCHTRWLYWTAMGPSRRAIQTSNRQSLPVILAGYTGQLWGSVEEPFKQAIDSLCLSFSLAILDSYGAQQKSHSNKQQIVSACHSRWLYWTAMVLSRRAIQTSNRQSMPVILAGYTGQLWGSVEEPFKQAIDSLCLSYSLAILDSYGAQQKSHSNKQQIVSVCHCCWLYWTAMGLSRRAPQTSNRQSLPVILAGYTGQLWCSVEEPFKQAIDSLCLSFSLAILDSYGAQQKSHSNKLQIVSACHSRWLYWTAMGLSRRAIQTSNRQSLSVIVAGYTGQLWGSVEEPLKQAIDSPCLSFSLAILDSYGAQQKSHSNKQQIVSACHSRWLYWTAMGLSRRAIQTSNRQSLPVILIGYTGQLWGSVEEPFKQAIDSLCLSFSLAILDSYGAQQKSHSNKQQIVSACHSRWLYWTAMGLSRRAIQTSYRQSLPVILAGYTGQLWGSVEEPFKQAIDSLCLSFSLAILDSYGAQQKSHSNKLQIVSACHSRWLYWTAMGLSRRAIQTSNRQSLSVIVAGYTGQLWGSVEEPLKQAIDSPCLSFSLAILDSYGAQQKSHSNKQQIVSACHSRWLYWTAMGLSRRAIQTSNRQSMPVILAGYTEQLWGSVEEPFKQAIDSLCLSFSLAILDSYGTQQKSHSNKQQIVYACHSRWLYWTAMGPSRRAIQTSNRQSLPVILIGYTGQLWDSVEEPFKQAIDSLCLSFSLAILDSYGSQMSIIKHASRTRRRKRRRRPSRIYASSQLWRLY